jgi:hypothetical protein
MQSTRSLIIRPAIKQFSPVLPIQKAKKNSSVDVDYWLRFQTLIAKTLLKNSSQNSFKKWMEKYQEKTKRLFLISKDNDPKFLFSFVSINAHILEQFLESLCIDALPESLFKKIHERLENPKNQESRVVFKKIAEQASYLFRIEKMEFFLKESQLLLDGHISCFELSKNLEKLIFEQSLVYFSSGGVSKDALQRFLPVAALVPNLLVAEQHLREGFLDHIPVFKAYLDQLLGHDFDDISIFLNTSSLPGLSAICRSNREFLFVLEQESVGADFLLKLQDPLVVSISEGQVMVETAMIALLSNCAKIRFKYLEMIPKNLMRFEPNLLMIREQIDAVFFGLPLQECPYDGADFAERYAIKESNCFELLQLMITQRKPWLSKLFHLLSSSKNSVDELLQEKLPESFSYLLDLKGVIHNALLYLGNCQKLSTKIKPEFKATVSLFDKRRAESLFLGDIVGCCLATKGNRFHGILQRVVDLSMPIIAIEDVHKNIVGIAWGAVVRCEETQEVGYVNQFFEISAEHITSPTQQEQIVGALIQYMQLLCKTMSLNFLILNPMEYGMISNPKGFDLISSTLKRLSATIMKEDTLFFKAITDGKKLFYSVPLEDK